MTTKTQKFRSKWWYVLPIFLHVIGGIIGWIALKKDDGKLAKNCLLLGIILSVVWSLVLYLILLAFENFSFSSDLGNIFGNNNFDIEFKIQSP
ncbi:MAG: hypothetical protein ACE5RE_06400 [Candidatus Nitrosomaritimum aestuariumsis]